MYGLYIHIYEVDCVFQVPTHRAGPARIHSASVYSSGIRLSGSYGCRWQMPNAESFLGLMSIIIEVERCGIRADMGGREAQITINRTELMDYNVLF